MASLVAGVVLSFVGGVIAFIGAFIGYGKLKKSMHST